MWLFQLSYTRTTKQLSLVPYSGAPVTDGRMELVEGVRLIFLIMLGQALLGFCLFAMCLILWITYCNCSFMWLLQLLHARTTKRLSGVSYSGAPVTDCRMELVGDVGLDFLITLGQAALGFCIFCAMFLRFWITICRHSFKWLFQLS